MGQRFEKASGELTIVVDVYGPDIFHSVADYSRFHNWQKAVTEHEIVMYNGHSVLGTGYAFERADYPDTYQIFQVASCLSYEYYVQPILGGKGGWENLDIMSSVVEVSADANRGRVVIEVVDNGPGIAAEDRQRVFQRFFRAADANPASSASASRIPSNCFSRAILLRASSTPVFIVATPERPRTSVRRRIPPRAHSDHEPCPGYLCERNGQRPAALELDADRSRLGAPYHALYHVPALDGTPQHEACLAAGEVDVLSLFLQPVVEAG